MGVEWGELPTDIIQLISKFLTIYADYLLFRTVCRSWRSSLPKTPLHLPLQLPCLMLSSRAFFHLSNHKTHLLNNLPESSHRTRYCGSSHGWLVILDETPNINLLNPITRATRATRPLPALHTFPNVVSFCYSNIGREYLVRNSHGALDALSLRQMCNSFIRKIVLLSSPSHSKDFTAFAIVGPHNLAFCRKGHDSWSFVIISEEELYCWEDVIYHNGLFYVVSKEGTIAVCDVEGSLPPQATIIQTAPIEFSGDIYYTVFLGEEMLLISRILEHEFDDDDAGGDYNLVYKTVRFEIFKMNWSELKWQKIETLGDWVLFLGGNSSLCLLGSDFIGCLRDCIYFTDDYSEANYDDACGKHDVGMFRLWDQSIELLPCYPRNSYSRLGWPLPIWVSPNPC